MIQLPVLNKPPRGAPCNGCGHCCREEACLISVMLLKSSAAPCIALEFDGERHRCGMVTRPAHYLGLPPIADQYLAPNHAFLLGMGMGCDAGDE